MTLPFPLQPSVSRVFCIHSASPASRSGACWECRRNPTGVVGRSWGRQDSDPVPYVSWPSASHESRELRGLFTSLAFNARFWIPSKDRFLLISSLQRRKKGMPQPGRG